MICAWELLCWLRRYQKFVRLVIIFRCWLLVFTWTFFLDAGLVFRFDLLLFFNFILVDEIDNFFALVPDAVSLPLRFVSARSFFPVSLSKGTNLFEHSPKGGQVWFNILFLNWQAVEDFAFEAYNRMEVYFDLICRCSGTPNFHSPGLLLLFGEFLILYYFLEVWTHFEYRSRWVS